MISYLIGITLVLIWLLHVLYLVVDLSFNPFLILAIHCNRRRETLSMPKYSLKQQIWNSIGEFNHCLHQWERDSVECWQRHESIWHGTIRLLFRECIPLRTRSSFKRFLYCGSKVLGVVQSTKCVVLKWETVCTFSTCVVRSFFYLDVDFVDILFRVPQCYLFCRRTLFAYFKSLIKISKGFKKWNFPYCFSKTGLNTRFSFY